MKSVFVIIQCLIISFIVICFTITFTSTDEGITNKYLYYQITTASMQADSCEYKIDSISVSDLIIVKKNLSDEFYSDLNIGDVITFEMTTGVLSGCVITHRIIYIENTNDSYLITTKGDNSNSVELLDTSVDTIYGSVVYVSSSLGVLYDIFSSYYFLALVMIAPCSIVIVLELFKIKKTIKTKRGSV